MSSDKELRKARKSLPDLPDVTKWKPTNPRNAETLQQAFWNRCGFAELEILQRAANERKMNIHNFDSGSGLEDIIRDQLRAILPSRYSIRPATLNDRKGQSAGDFDVVIANDEWFPAIKAGATPISRKVYLPIEAAYAAIEVKQTLTPKTLDDNGKVGQRESPA